MVFNFGVLNTSPERLFSAERLFAWSKSIAALIMSLHIMCYLSFAIQVLVLLEFFFFVYFSAK